MTTNSMDLENKYTVKTHSTVEMDTNLYLYSEKTEKKINRKKKHFVTRFKKGEKTKHRYIENENKSRKQYC